MLIIIIIVAIMFATLFFCYRMKYDTVIAFTGGLGSGKTFLSVKTSLKLYKRQLRKAKIYNFLHRKNKKELPKLYSNVPIVITKSHKKIAYSELLTPEHLLLRSHIALGSVVLIDEVGAFASQFDFNNPNIRDNFDEFVRFYRHYTKGGYLVVNDQCSENIVLQIRRRINTVYNLTAFRVWLPKIVPILWTVKVRNVSISEEIKTIEENDKEDNMTTMFGLMSMFSLFAFYRHYDTYCYSGRYKSVPLVEPLYHKKLNTNKLLAMPKNRVIKKTTDDECNE